MKISLMEKINDFHMQVEKSGQEINDGITVSIEVDSNNLPIGVLVKQVGNPMVLLGLYDMLLEQVQEHKKRILDKFQSDQKLSSLINSLPGGLGPKIKILEMRMRQAVAQRNDAEIANIQKELDDLLENSKKDIEDALRKKKNSDDGKGPDEDGFTIKDFMGGL